MRHSHTSRGLRTSAKALLAIVGLGFAGACADSFNAPTSEVSAKAPAGYNKKDGVTTFQYIPKQGATKRFGDHMIVIAANGVCDPATSGYGAMATDNWNAPCTAVNHPIVFTATSWTDADGHPYVEFQPAVRFVPDKETYLYLRDGKRTAPTDLTIRYCPTVDNCIDESVNDLSLATHRVGNSAIIGRRLKHFSGYNIAAAAQCSGVVQLLDDGSLYCATGLMRSGYMVASGLGKSGNGDAGLGRRRRSGDKTDQ